MHGLNFTFAHPDLPFKTIPLFHQQITYDILLTVIFSRLVPHVIPFESLEHPMLSFFSYFIFIFLSYLIWFRLHSDVVSFDPQPQIVEYRLNPQFFGGFLIFCYF